MHKLQVIIPFFIAGIGTCCSGIFLDHVQFWEVFGRIKELFIVLPALLGLKGNLQMTLASRFSTHTHMKHIETKSDLLSLALTNIAINQCFSIIICFLSCFLSIVIAARYEARAGLLVISTALITSSLTSFVLDTLMIMIVWLAAMYNINPDNIATPIASSLGDLFALLLCTFVSTSFLKMFEDPQFYYITCSTIVISIIILPFLVVITHDNEFTSQILYKGAHWYPLLSAMLISTISGIILQTAVTRYSHIALFTPVLNGIGGNLVAVQASRLASLLHQTTKPGELPEGESVCMNPMHLFTSDNPGFSISRLLMVLALPGQVIFFYICIVVNPNCARPTYIFFIAYLLSSEIQVILLIYIAYALTYALWSMHIDPDNTTIPYLTSISDVIGSTFLSLICISIYAQSEQKFCEPSRLSRELNNLF